jgi:hypothetical protein
VLALLYPAIRYVRRTMRAPRRTGAPA